MMKSGTPGERMRLVQAKLGLARRFRDLTLEQQALTRKLPSEQALSRIYTLADERQECIDEYNALTRAEAELGAVSADYLDDERGLDKVLAELQAVLADAAAVDQENLAALAEQRDNLLKQIRKMESGRQALNAYGKQSPEAPPAAFVDKSK